MQILPIERKHFIWIIVFALTLICAGIISLSFFFFTATGMDEMEMVHVNFALLPFGYLLILSGICCLGFLLILKMLDFVMNMIKK